MKNILLTFTAALLTYTAFACGLPRGKLTAPGQSPILSVQRNGVVKLEWNPLAASDLPQTVLACSLPPDEFTAHEWGTFTSVQGAEGVQLEWNPLVASDLPPFVYNVNRLPRDPAGRPAPVYYGKTAARSLQRMETPVIYFYSDRERTVDVSVRFPRGHITEWYPQLSPNSFTTPGRINQLVWDRLTILPRAQHPELQAQLPAHSAPSHYFPAREAEADFLRRTPGTDAKPELESLLFYRGVGYFNAPLTVSLPEGSNALRVKNEGAEPLRSLFVLQVNGTQAKYTYVDQLGTNATQDIVFPCRRSSRPRAEVTAQLVADMQQALVREGLFEREAAAMVKTWSDSWFAEPGVRVLYLLPRTWTDRTLPLTVSPAPTKTVRVMVGRAEVITPTIETAVLGQLQRFIAAEPDDRAQIVSETQALGLGRFLEPTVRRLAGRIPAQQFSTLGWEFLQQASRPVPALVSAQRQ